LSFSRSKFAEEGNKLVGGVKERGLTERGIKYGKEAG